MESTKKRDWERGCKSSLPFLTSWLAFRLPSILLIQSINDSYRRSENGVHRRRLHFTLQAVVQSPNAHTYLSLPPISVFRFRCFCIQSTRDSYRSGLFRWVWRWFCISYVPFFIWFVQRSRIQVSSASWKVNSFSSS